MAGGPRPRRAIDVRRHRRANRLIAFAFADAFADADADADAAMHRLADMRGCAENAAILRSSRTSR